MEIEIKNTIVRAKKVKIELPYYTKSSCHYYKVIDEKTVILVTLMTSSDYFHHNQIAFSNIDNALSEKKTTENEFLKAYNKVLNQIQKHI
jgi:hypothetical protein